MKFTLTINQKAIIDLNLKNGLNLDIIDAHLLEFCCAWFSNSKATKVACDGIAYTWISHKLISDNLPLLGIKKDTIYRRMKVLTENGFFLYHPNSKIIGMTLYCQTALLDSINFETVQEISNNSHLKSIGLESEPSDLNPYPIGSRSVPPSDLDPNYYTNKINSNIINKEQELCAEQSSATAPKNEIFILEEEKQKIKKEKSCAKKEEQDADTAKNFFEVCEILALFTKLNGISFKIPKTRKLFERYDHAKIIQKTIEKGYNLQQCLDVLIFKHKEWGNDARMMRYVCPQTIFSPKFDLYLTQLEIVQNNPLYVDSSKNNPTGSTRFERMFRDFAQGEEPSAPF